jgi:hypothetical protein
MKPVARRYPKIVQAACQVHVFQLAGGPARHIRWYAQAAVGLEQPAGGFIGERQNYL